MFLRILVFLCISSLSLAQDKYERETLRGLKGVSVVIEGLSSDAKREGLTKSQLQTEVELRLRRSGIPVLESRDAPYLYVNVTTVSSLPTNLHAVAINVALNQDVYLRRYPTILLYGATTWAQTSTLIVSGNRLREFVRENVGSLVDKFGNDYLAVNPRFQTVKEELEIAGKTFWLGMTKEEVLANIPKGYTWETRESFGGTPEIAKMLAKTMDIRHMTAEVSPDLNKIPGHITFDSGVSGHEGADAKVVGLSRQSKYFDAPEVTELHKTLHRAIVWVKDGKQLDIVQSETYGDEYGEIKISIGKRTVSIPLLDGTALIKEQLQN